MEPGARRRVDLRADEGQAKGDERPRRGVWAAAFGETANPADYVPREASERALRELEAEVRQGRIVALTASPGLGRSLLLRIVSGRLEPAASCVFLPYAALELDELCAWALGLLEHPADDAPSRALLGAARRRSAAGGELMLVIDDAGSMPLETARGLARLVADSGNRLRLLIGVADDAASSRVLAALHPQLAEVRFREPMTLRETRLYLETRLEQSRVPRALRERFGPAEVGWIHRLSGGVPRRVHELAAALLEDAPAGVGRAWHEEHWLGEPIEGDDDWKGDPLDPLDAASEPEPAPEPPEVLCKDDDPEAV